MNDRALREGTPEQRHRQRVSDQLLGHTPIHRPADDRARIQIHHHRQIQPTLVGPHVRDATDPFLIRPSGRKVLIDQILGDRLVWFKSVVTLNFLCWIPNTHMRRATRFSLHGSPWPLTSSAIRGAP